MIVAVIPAYNEEKAITSVVSEAKRHVDKVLVCDDGSQDTTRTLAENAGAIVLTHEKNMGYGASLITLFNEAKSLGATVVVTLDGDGQHDASEIPSFIKRVSEGDVDFVIGSRFLEGSNTEAPGWRNYGIQIINRLAKTQSVDITDSQSGFRAYNQKALNSLKLHEFGMGISTEILIKAGKLGLRCTEVPIHVRYFEDSSQYNPVSHGLSVVLCTLKHQIIVDEVSPPTFDQPW